MKVPLQEWIGTQTVGTVKIDGMIRDSVALLAAEEEALLGVAWDKIHEAGWRVDQCEIERDLQRMEATLVIKHPLLGRVRVFQLNTSLEHDRLDGFCYGIRSYWLRDIPVPA